MNKEKIETSIRKEAEKFNLEIENIRKKQVEDQIKADKIVDRMYFDCILNQVISSYEALFEKYLSESGDDNEFNFNLTLFKRNIHSCETDLEHYLKNKIKK